MINCPHEPACDRVENGLIVAVAILDLESAGRSPEARYKYFLNRKVKWPIQEPDGKLIQQEHDRTLLRTTVEQCKKAAGHWAKPAQMAMCSLRSPVIR